MAYPIFEVRIPSCNRPELLRRAVESIYSQTYPHWRAVVYDDSNNEKSQNLIEAYNDNKVTYVRNSPRRGAAGNIDFCFAPEAQFGGAYGCLLEDDNFWMPTFLETVQSHVRRKDWSLLLANQRVFDQTSGVLAPDETTRGSWFDPGAVDPLELRARLLFMEGLSNGGMVWKLENKVDLRVGASVKETGLHEACRSLLVSETFFFVDEALAVWTSMPKTETARSGERSRLISRGTQSVREFVLNVHGKNVLDIAYEVAGRHNRIDKLAQAVAYAGFMHAAWRISRAAWRQIALSAAKGIVVRLVERDPCGDFMNLMVERSAHATLADIDFGRGNLIL